MDLAAHIKDRRIKIIGARKDQTVPIELVWEFAGLIKDSIIEEIDTDHDFEGIDEVDEMVG